MELNAKLASAMGSPVLMSLDMRPGVSPEDAARSAAIARDTITAAGARVLGLVLDRVGRSILPAANLRRPNRLSTNMLELLSTSKWLHIEQKLPHCRLQLSSF